MKGSSSSDIRSRLWNSVELAHIRGQLIVIAVFYLLMMGFLSLRRSGFLPLVLASLMLGPFVIFYLIQILRIFCRVEEYVFCKTELSRPNHFPMTRGMFTFTGIIEADGSRFPVETHAIFAGHGIIEPLMEDFVGKTVTIAWNRKTEMVVVIG